MSSIIHQESLTQLPSPQPAQQLCLSPPQHENMESFDNVSVNNNNNVNKNELQAVQQTLEQASEADFSIIQSLGGVVNVNINEKIAIYQHPLFPLLRALFEKCEAVTISIDHANSLNFENEIKNFISQMAKENKPYFTDNPEVDTLVCIYIWYLIYIHNYCKTGLTSITKDTWLPGFVI